MTRLDILLPKHFASPSLLMVLASHSWTARTDCVNVPKSIWAQNLPAYFKSHQTIPQQEYICWQYLPCRSWKTPRTACFFPSISFISEHPFNLWADAAQGTGLGNGTLMGHSLGFDLLTTWAVPHTTCTFCLPSLSNQDKINASSPSSMQEMQVILSAVSLEITCIFGNCFNMSIQHQRV